MEGHRWQRTLDAIARIHRAGLAPERWPAALKAVVTTLDAGKAVMFEVDLRTAYGLTPAEASLTVGLPGGATISEIAARQDIAVDTARKRLKAEFEKTRSYRQAELVQRVLSDFEEL